MAGKAGVGDQLINVVGSPGASPRKNHFVSLRKNVSIQSSILLVNQLFTSIQQQFEVCPCAVACSSSDCFFSQQPNLARLTRTYQNDAGREKYIQIPLFFDDPNLFLTNGALNCQFGAGLLLKMIVFFRDLSHFDKI